ncbi:thiamine-binding protein [Desulfosporosinus sp. PR]|uniref:thiamine-binding protein n=1 Tax=Candidatus Desulfosporosinus nitrosoreducens TaxID=3401928 RepID=UPI0027EDB98B|nr:thiamine-binding protein [Desulfosporosinus sp. PR]MDQ7095325.1 thiamine-binding protein [Desulfosporosinus sp. PR]
MAKIMMAFQVLPKVEDSRLFEVVDEAIAVVAASGVTYEVGPMETTMEGEPDQLWAIIREAQDACIKAGASRVLTYIKMDYNPGKTTIEEKIKKYREK